MTGRASVNRVWIVWRIDSAYDYTLLAVFSTEAAAHKAMAEYRDKVGAAVDEFEVHSEVVRDD